MFLQDLSLLLTRRLFYPIVSIHSGIFGARFYVLHHMCCENKTSHFLLLGMGAFLSVGDTVSLLPPLPYNLYAFLLPPALFA